MAVLRKQTSAPADFAAFDHVIEGSLEVPSGMLLARDMDREPNRIALPQPGWYRVRVYFSGLDTLNEDGTEGDDKYRAVLWSEPSSKPIKILKQRQPA